VRMLRSESDSVSNCQSPLLFHVFQASNRRKALKNQEKIGSPG
jgi:hypothetical protein